MKTNMDCNTCDGQEICCSQSVYVSPAEVQKLSLPPGTTHMNQDNTICQFFQVGRCSVYPKRPRTCIDFNCCNPDQVKMVPGGSREEVEQIKKSLTPSVWLSVELNKRR